MAQYDNTNRGIIGKNKNPKSANSPESTGRLNIQGRDFWIAGWLQEDFLSDVPYISLAINPADGEEAKGSGTLKQNTGKIGRQPDYRGQVCVDSCNYEIAAWNKVTEKGKFLSISVDASTPKTAERNNNVPDYQSAPGTTGNNDPLDFDDDIPFIDEFRRSRPLGHCV